MRYNVIIWLLALTSTGIAYVEKATCYLNKKPIHECFKSALSTVLIKQTGRHGIINEPAVQSALKKPAEYVHTYRSLPEGMLEVSFKSEATHELINETSFPVWSGKRPSTMIWVIQEPKANMIDEQNKKLVIAYAQKRGVQTMFPLDDLETEQMVQNIHPSMIYKKLWHASKRYHVDNALIAVIPTNEHSNSIQWKLLNDNRELNWEQSNTALVQNIYSAIDHIVEQYVSENNNLSSSIPSSNHVKVEVSNIKNYKSLLDLSKILKRIQGIKKIHINSITQDHVLIELMTSLTPEQIQKELSNTSQIQSEASSPLFQEATFHYSLALYAA